ncbi:HD domain-containing protein [Bradyrhizobium sp. Tv2a-2]|uniref:HD domain-containing protein n=1 Tax=Bradyrhizobium sp. Tv2a-2 TaxID=113395 RepID=UPI0004064DA7|nr:HD domain-containing protein [Bradyrhizobium sp. Tv2a-2]
MNIVDKARKFAERAHATQARKYTGEKYFVHLHEVAELCRQFGLGKTAIAAAYLHDTVEDQPVTHQDLEREFGREIAGIVRELTDVPAVPGGPTRKQRKAMDLARLEAAGADAQSIKCADLISNTSSIVRHDPHFARTYLPEKRAALTVLTRANTGLHALAWLRLLEAEKQLDA